LRSAYPELKFEATKFSKTHPHYWKSPSRKKEFFDNVAKKKAFDPLLAENWYKLGKKALLREKINTILPKHIDGNFSTISPPSTPLIRSLLKTGTPIQGLKLSD